MLHFDFLPFDTKIKTHKFKLKFLNGKFILSIKKKLNLLNSIYLVLYVEAQVGMCLSFKEHFTKYHRHIHMLNLSYNLCETLR